MPPEMELVMKGVVKIVNFIKVSALNNCLFETLCAHHTCHLFILLSDGCQKVRWSATCRRWGKKTPFSPGEAVTTCKCVSWEEIAVNCHVLLMLFLFLKSAAFSFSLTSRSGWSLQTLWTNASFLAVVKAVIQDLFKKSSLTSCFH